MQRPGPQGRAFAFGSSSLQIAGCGNVGPDPARASSGQQKEKTMRFMMLMYPGPKAETEQGPGDMDVALIEAMTAYNQRLVDAGVMLDGAGLHPTMRGARVRFGKGKAAVTDGPVTETKEILGGYWMIQAASLEEAVAWARQAPCPEGEMIEIRRVYEPEDFGETVAAQERQMIADMEARKEKG
jgi:hypothetical protein